MRRTVTGFRIECEDGNGIWRTRNQERLDDVFEKSYDKHSTRGKDGMKSPAQDIGRYIMKHEKCAYKSIKMMKRWMNMKELAEGLRNCGIKVYKLTLYNPVIGHHQYIFTRSNLIKKVDVTNLFLSKY